MGKILVTGASGFIGKNLIQELLYKSLNILAFSRSYGLDYEKINSKYIDDQNVEVIIHLAGKAHDLKNQFNEQEYFKVNTDLTVLIYDEFLKSKAKTFIYFSTVKAVKDHYAETLSEETIPSPITSYGKSKFKAETYLLSKIVSTEKRIIIFRPCMVHGPGNKGNLNLLYNFVSKQLPWPLGAFNNYRSFCCIDNLCFVVNEIISRPEILSGIYNIADDDVISTNRIIELIGISLNKKPMILSINKNIIQFITKVGDIIKLPLNSERLTKLTESYIVSNIKIKTVIGKKLPLTTEEGLLKTFQSFIK
jgi:nucleoside-diphosphate-sugar epimerase